MAVHAKKGSHSEWNTPEVYITAARKTMGSISMDPMSNHEAQKTVKADRYFTRENPFPEDRKDWHGNVWLNPAYSDYKGQGSDMVKLATLAYAGASIRSAIMLVNQSILYQDGPQLALTIGSLCIPDHRIKYINGYTGLPQEQPPQSNAFIYLGKQENSFQRWFKTFGVVLHNARGYRV